MTAIFLKSFSGERPKLDPRHLPNESAQIAKGCHFYHGNLSPLRLPLVNGDSVLPNTKTIFRYLNQHWFSWGTDVDAVNSPVANDPWQRVYLTGDGYPKVTNNAIFSGANMPSHAYRLGVQAPEAKIVAVINEPETPPVGEETNDPTNDETRFYTSTYVTEQGEEGPPGDSSLLITLQYPQESTVTLTMSPPDVNQSNITKRRIYRTSTGGGIADYLLVAEVPIAQASYVDNVSGDLLSAALETYDYEQPPVDLAGLTNMANGILAGFTGNTVCFSEAFLPYAWPSGYQMTTEHDIVGMAAMGNTLVVLTKGYPWFFSGVSPSSMSGQKIESEQSCASKSSIVVVRGTVLYASPDGLAAVTSGGVEIITSNIITQEQWQAYKPSTIKAFSQEGRYLGFYGDNLEQAFIFDPETMDFRHVDQRIDCGFNDLSTDALYLCDVGVISQWEASNSVMPYVWRSKKYQLSDLSLGCALVKGKNLELTGLKILLDGVVVLDKPPGTLTDYAFRLPSVRGDDWEFELYGSGDVESVVIASSISDIKRVANGN